MELVLHIGTNKTGSSFIQTVLIQNKEFLSEYGIYLPSSRWDSDMLDGKLTAGNGQHLASLLHEEDEPSLKGYLQGVRIKAEQENYPKVLFSCEILIRLFSNKNILELLVRSANMAGFESIQCISCFRPVFDHALSLYKHRAKSGKWNDYQQWMVKNYEFLRVTKQFLNHYKEFEIGWTFLPYYKNPKKHISTFFNEGLKISTQRNFNLNSVNTSLTLNNIRIIQEMESEFPNIHRILTSYLSSGEAKGIENTVLFEKFGNVAKVYFENNWDVINMIKELLPSHFQEEFIAIPTFNISKNSISTDCVVVLSEAHLLLIKKSLKVYKRKKFIFNLNKHLKKIIIFFKKHSQFNSERYGGSMHLTHF